MIITPPTVTPITVAEVRDHCRIDGTTEDDQLAVMINAAVRVAQATLCEQLCTATRVVTLDAWPKVHVKQSLPYSPVQSITSIKYYDADNELQTLVASEYFAMTLGVPGGWQLSHMATRPTLYPREDAIQLTYVCGYGEAADVPDAIRVALLQMCHDWYTDRSAVGMPTQAAQDLLTAAGHGAYTS